MRHSRAPRCAGGSGFRRHYPVHMKYTGHRRRFGRWLATHQCPVCGRKEITL